MSHDDPRGIASLHRLRLAGLVAPVAFVAILFAVRPLVLHTFGLPVGHAILGTVLFLSAAAFGLAMHNLIGRAHTAVVDAERQTAALVERDRIARELHDSLAQVLGVTHLRLRALAARPAVATDERVRTEVDDLALLCRDAHGDVREAIMGLKDAHRPDRSLLEHLGHYVATFARTSGIETTLVTDLVDIPLSRAAEVQVIRVIQEALTNVRKHAGARSATVHITTDADRTVFTVADDGAGFDPHRPHGGDTFGLTTMRERTESVAGRLRIDSAPGRGTRVVVALPGRPLPTSPSRPRHRPLEELSA